MNSDIKNKENLEDVLMSLKFMDVLPKDGTALYTYVIDVLAQNINELIPSKLHRLLVLLYRLDINEDKVKRALLIGDKLETAGHRIARLILDRQIQKFHLRRKYSSRKS
ncbi:hypothetical protein ACL9RF_05200 [Sphingobacterium sp. Mn56C]|uniref:hypothetical protein n=1 Tax=Sphingobacterium sp. Mn56C TaxID=3395261 RepID=UPI003BEC0101